MRCSLSLAAALAALAFPGHAAAEPTFRTILAPGQQAPGMEPGVIAAYVAALGIGPNGHVVIGADVGGPGVISPDNSVTYIGLPDSLNLWFREGAQAPGLEPGTGLWGIPFLSDLDQPAFVTASGGTVAMCRLQGPTIGFWNNETVYVVQPNGQMEPALRDGQPAPQWGDSTGVEFGSPFTNLGLYTFTVADDLRFLKPVMVEGETVLYGGFAHDPQIQVRVGGPAPGIPGATITDVQVTDGTHCKPVVAGAGKIILRGTIAGPGIDASNDQVFWGGEIGALQVLHRQGDGVPGLHPGNRTTITGELGWHDVNAAGQALFWTWLVPGAGDTTSGVNDGVVLTGSPGNISVAVRKGDQVPGLPAGVVYGDVAFGHIGNGGVLGLMTSLAGPGIASANYNDNAILTGQPGALTVRMREGQQVPGLPPNYVYGDPDLGSDRVFFNRVGAFAARVAIRDLSADDTYIGSIIYWPPGGGDPTVVLRNDEPIQVAPGDVRSFFRAVPYGLSDNGEILIHVRFDEDDAVTGAFIATVDSTGACCVGSVCSVGTQAQCAGEFQGNGSTCGTAGNPTTCCAANFDGVGGVAIADIFAMLTAWFLDDPGTDFNNSGTRDIGDIFAFLGVWFTGCG